MGYSYSNTVPSQSTPYFTNATPEIKAHLCLNFFNACLKYESHPHNGQAPVVIHLSNGSGSWAICLHECTMAHPFKFLFPRFSTTAYGTMEFKRASWPCLVSRCTALIKERKERKGYRHPLWNLRYFKASYSFAVGNGSDQTLMISHGWFELFPYSLRLATLKNFLALWNFQQKIHCKICGENVSSHYRMAFWCLKWSSSLTEEDSNIQSSLVNYRNRSWTGLFQMGKLVPATYQ